MVYAAFFLGVGGSLYWLLRTESPEVGKNEGGVRRTDGVTAREVAIEKENNVPIQDFRIGVLKPIKGLTIDPIDKTEPVVHISSQFATLCAELRKKFGNEAGAATKETAVDVYEVIENATIAKIFNLFLTPFICIDFTEAQINCFMKKYYNWMKQSQCIALLVLKSHEIRFVLGVCAPKDSDEPMIIIFEFDDPKTIPATDGRYRVVVPRKEINVAI